MKINKRLIAVAEYVSDNSKVIDVGCDHAFLCIYLVQNKKNVFCIASDVNEGPLKQARKNIDQYNLTDKIEVRLGSGLDTIDNDVDTVVISGMGGKTICNILKDGRDKLDCINELVLSPNSDFYIVRKCISDLGYTIESEQIVQDKGKFYPIIHLQKGNKRYTKKQLLLGVNIKENDAFKQYRKYLCSKVLHNLDSIPKRYFIKRWKMKNYYKLIKRY